MRQITLKLRLPLCVLLLCTLLLGCHRDPLQPIVTLPTASAESAPPATTAAPDTTARTEPATETAPLPDTTAGTEPSEPEPDGGDYLIRWQNGGQKDYLPDEPVEMVPFSEMQYVRPDTERLFARFTALTETAADSEDAEALLEEYYALYSDYISFYSMDVLANIRHSLDVTDSFYMEEYNFCEEQTPNVEEKFEALMKAFAASPSRYELEELYFGEDFFEKYDDYEVYTNEEYLRLSQQEKALLAQYRDVTSDMQVTFQNETKTLEEWLETDAYFTYIGALKAYYEQYNSRLGEIYVELVKVRRQLAQALDYDNYAEYSYDIAFERDYTPEQGAAFLEDIRTELVPVLKQANSNAALSLLSAGPASEQEVAQMLKSAAQNIGGPVWDAWRFMDAYELSDIHAAPEKVEASFESYLYDYEAPFILVNASGSSTDYTTFAHEFGHFTDAYYNYGANEDLETAETFSQAMEYLALYHTDTLSQTQRNTLTKLSLLDLLQTFVFQGAYADFEARVYELDPDELTVEAVNAIFLQCSKDYGFYEPGFDFYYSQCWIDVLHFYEVPYYIISYCVSAETALQVYQLEAEQAGEGVAAYFRLLDRDYEAGVQAVMEGAGLASPFRDGVLAQTAAFFRETLGLNKNDQN